MEATVEQILDAIETEYESVFELATLADSIAWQIAKDEGAPSVTFGVWERALGIAKQQLEGEL